MLSKKKLLAAAKLYLILDAQVNTYQELFEIAKQSVASGVDIIQLRDKTGTARDILELSKKILRLTKQKIPFIINDRVDLAVAAKASGVHLGQEDLSVAVARKLLPAQAIVGVSCQTLEHVRRAHQDKADYIGFGSVFKTLTKPERQPMDLNLLKQVMRYSKLPVFAIGGIELKNIDLLRSAGVTRCAVCRSVCQAKNIGEAVRLFKKRLNSR